MQSSQIIEALKDIKGQHVKVVWCRECDTYKGNIDKVTKRTIAYVRSGIDFANLTEVKAEIAAFERGEIQPIWGGKGQWTAFPFVFAHIVTGSEYVRLYPASFDNLRKSMDVQFHLNGKPVDKAQVLSVLTAKERQDRDENLKCFCVKVESIETIGI